MSVTIIGPLAEGGVQLPFYSFKVPAGFPYPAADHLEQHISIDELLDIRAPIFTWCVLRVTACRGQGSLMATWL